MITALAHICLTVKDLDASVAFYQEKMHLTPAFDFVNEQGKRFGVYLHAGGRSFIELFQGNPEAPSSAHSYQHMCFEVMDIQSAVADLRALGVEVSEVKMGSDHSWQAWLQDPDGNRIELHGYTAESKQVSWLM